MLASRTRRLEQELVAVIVGTVKKVSGKSKCDLKHVHGHQQLMEGLGLLVNRWSTERAVKASYVFIDQNCNSPQVMGTDS